VEWTKAQQVPGLSLEVVRLPGRTPLIFMELPANGVESTETVLLYGHLDKQPPLLPWAEGLHPYKPVIRDGKLYGRAGADDGYALFSSITAIKALQAQGAKYPRTVVIIEASEESGSPDLPAYIEHLKERIGNVSLVICLDSGCGNYEQFWLTTSLRGVVMGVLKVTVLKEGVHSGAASGIVPSSFRVLRHVLSRLENPETGEILCKELYVDIPKERIEQAKEAAQNLGKDIYREIPFVEGMKPAHSDHVELLLNKTWRPQLAVVGCDGIPSLEGGNVLRTHTAVKLSVRLPPTTDATAASAALKKLFEENPPYGAKVEYLPLGGAAGWASPILSSWLSDSVQKASQEVYKKPCLQFGEGGTIPFMGMLGKQFPKAEFVITGVLGPASNAHGPNEFLHLDMAVKVTACVAHILSDYANKA
jgi:acetylornithine deacetylase/succinyl-diaminopimelate desuccinylase-like protein